jgi:phosphomannomutase
MPFGFFEAPGIVTLKLLQLLSEYNKPVSEYVAPLYRYSHSGEINFVVDDKATVFGRLKEKYQDHLKYDFDGVYYEWPEWWFSVRASNTENVVRLNLEAVNRDVMETRLVEVKGLVLGN